MLTVVIETSNDEEALARTLGSLVPAAVEGVVREVLVCDRGSSDQTRTVADHAGCTVIAEGDFAAGLKRARGDWLLLLEPGARLVDGWMDEVLAHVGTGAMPARFSRVRNGRARFLPRFFSRSRPLADGFLISRRQALGRLQPGEGSDAIVRGRPGKRLRAGIAPSDRKS